MPVTAPPCRAIFKAWPRLERAALAARMLVRMETNMPVKPAKPEQMAPIRKLMTTFPAKGRGKVGKLVAHKESHGQHDGQRADGGVLARHERFRALANGVRNQPHFRGSGIVSQHRAGQKQGKNQTKHTGDQSNPEKRAATGVDGSGRALPEDSGR